MSEALIRLEGIEFSYPPDREVLAGVDFALSPGERVGLVGPNGCGKTTLLHIMVGLLKPTAGTLGAFGKPRREEADFHEVRRRAGLVFQDGDDQLFCPTVIEDVAFGPLNLDKSPREARAVATETLRLVGLEGFEERITYKLSGGEKRLVSLATILAMKPDVLLLDEPTGALDEASKQRVGEVLRGLPQAMIIVSHERGFLEPLTTRILGMSGGKLVANSQSPIAARSISR
ncbi:MAG: ABC transporter ATP-binding protein [Planctomycetes bacterium]|nr:ABC transporter ATP-binding protein [Planctomycetota bacterium]